MKAKPLFFILFYEKRFESQMAMKNPLQCHKLAPRILSNNKNSNQNVQNSKIALKKENS